MEEPTENGRDAQPTQHGRPVQDGARHARVYGLVLTEHEIREFLIRSAEEYDAEQCEDGGCDVCTHFVQMWTDVYGALSASYRLSVEEALEALDCPAPRRRSGGFR